MTLQLFTAYAYRKASVPVRESESDDVVPEGRLELLEERLENEGQVGKGMTVQEIRSE